MSHGVSYVCMYIHAVANSVMLHYTYHTIFITQFLKFRYKLYVASQLAPCSPVKYAGCTPGLILYAIIVLRWLCFLRMCNISDACTCTNRLLPFNVAFSLPMIRYNHYQDLKFVPFKKIILSSKFIQEFPEHIA